MTDIKELPAGTEIAVNENAMEPKDYFKILKSKLKKTQKDHLKAQLEVLAEQMIEAKKVGQRAFLERLSYTWTVVLSEQVLHSMGYETYVFKEDIKEFLDKVEPTRSIKIIELERYPRMIPIEALKEIQKAKDLNLFDDFCVVFTDFTDSDHSNPEERKRIKRNKDPVVFGFFKDSITGMQHERFYFIVDWEDENCDLTFNKMIEKMAAVGIKNPAKKTKNVDNKYIQDIADKALEEARKNGQDILRPPKKKSFWDRIRGK